MALLKSYGQLITVYGLLKQLSQPRELSNIHCKYLESLF